MPRRFLYILITILSPLFCISQNEFKGLVVDENNEALIAATVAILPDKTEGVICDFDGNFILKKDRDSLSVEISYVGYYTDTLTLYSNTKYTVILQEKPFEQDVTPWNGYRQAPYQTIGANKSWIKRLKALNDKEQQLNFIKIKTDADTSFSEPYHSLLNTYPKERNIGKHACEGKILFLISKRKKSIEINHLTHPKNRKILQKLHPKKVKEITTLENDTATTIYGSRAASGVVIIHTKRRKKIKQLHKHAAFRDIN